MGGPDSYHAMHWRPSAVKEVHCRPPETAMVVTDGSAPWVFDHNIIYSTDRVVLFWQPPLIVSHWSPSLHVVDDVSYSCAEQYTMAEKARLFPDHRAVELSMSSPDPTRARTHRSRAE